jgi:hypothetical protein
MTTCVYRFGCRMPTEGLDLVRQQLRAAHNYANDLTAIERGRRVALRAVDDTDEVREAIDLVKQATRSTRKQAVTKLRETRRTARESATDELDRIKLLEQTILRDARALTTTFWGTYLDVESAHRQSRAMPLYDDDAVTPKDPRFISWRGDGYVDGQVGIQLQGGLSTVDALRSSDTRVRLVLDPDRRDRSQCDPNARRARRRFGHLWLRVGSDGRDPIWAKIPILVDRPVPHSANWKWVRVSVRMRGLREIWSCEITVDDAAPEARTLDTELEGLIAVEFCWDVLDSGIRVANWCDDRGAHGEVILPAHTAEGIRKPDGIRAVRDMIANEFRPRFARLLRECGETLPPWLARARDTVHLWKSLNRLHELARRWRSEKCDLAREAYALLGEWEERDAHLYAYETGGRAKAIGCRDDFYYVIAKKWSQSYKFALISNQDLSREAQFGEESDRRFTAGCSKLRSAIRNAFGQDAWDGRWKDGPRGEEDERSWCERARDAWIAGGARKEAIVVPRKEKTGNAWARRKAKAAEKRALAESAREAGGNGTE